MCELVSAGNRLCDRVRRLHATTQINTTDSDVINNNRLVEQWEGACSLARPKHILTAGHKLAGVVERYVGDDVDGRIVEYLEVEKWYQVCADYAQSAPERDLQS